MSLYRHMKLDGDLASAMTPAEAPMHFTTGDLTLQPFYVSDPVPPGWEPPEPDPDSPFSFRGRRGPPTQPYHIYVKRVEPTVVFGSVDAGVENPAGADGTTFLDAVWARAPFESHDQFVSTVEEIAGEWQGDGALRERGRAAVVEAARRAEADLRV